MSTFPGDNAESRLSLYASTKARIATSGSAEEAITSDVQALKPEELYQIFVETSIDESW